MDSSELTAVLPSAAARGTPRADEAVREVTVDEAMAIAILFQRNGQLDDAEKIYRDIVAHLPDHADALQYLGVLSHQKGESEAAVSLIEQAITIEPRNPDFYNNLGIVLKGLGRIDDAASAYRKAIELNADQADAYNNLGVLLKAQDKLDDAEAVYRKAIEVNPNHADAYHNLGALLSKRNRIREAVVCYSKATTLEPRHAEAPKLLGMAYCTLGQLDKAVEVFERWLVADPANPVARHMLVACSGRDVPVRAPDAYVEKLFDGFAASFDVKLENLSYRAPQLIADALAEADERPARCLNVLDAGCGTGLCGPLIADYAARLVGVDLSGQMLAQAQRRGVYNELVKAELTAYLRGSSNAFDLIVSADTLVYFGALGEVLAAASGTLRQGGLLIFTVESIDDADDYRINPHGRYSHSEPYLRRAIGAAGLSSIRIVPVHLRLEGGEPVAGLCITCRKEGVEARSGWR